MTTDGAIIFAGDAAEEKTLEDVFCLISGCSGYAGYALKKWVVEFTVSIDIGF